jgi:hypothetical protein
LERAGDQEQDGEADILESGGFAGRHERRSAVSLALNDARMWRGCAVATEEGSFAP